MRNWDFERWLLTVMAVLIIGLGGFILWQQREANELRSALPQGEDTLAAIGKLAEDFYSLERELQDDELANGEPYAYIEDRIKLTRLPPTSFDFTRGAEKPFPSDGYQDFEIILKPAGRGGAFTREQIAMLLLNIESGTDRMKVTKLHLSRKDQGSVEDNWTVDVTLTDRQAYRQ